jgi:hypothetical protein
MTVPAVTVNKVCLSGLNAIALADQLPIRPEPPVHGPPMPHSRQ